MENKWIPVSTKPDSFQDVILYREDAGVFTGFYGNYAGCLPDNIVEEMGYLSEEELFEVRFFYYDFGGNGILELDTEPTHWMKLPEPPEN
ncbi:UNVERIFIED_CONTAM: DUF551 domain-containing protein [Ralstonia mannitolilytica]